MNGRSFLTLALVAGSSGCASLAKQRVDDMADVSRVVRERVGIEPSITAVDDATISPEVQGILEQELTEDAAVKIAVLNNREVRSTLEGLGVASAELVQAGLLSNPVFTANAKFFDAGTEIEIGVLQSFLDVFLLSTRKRVAQASLEETKARVAREVVRLAYDVRRAFVRVRASERLVEVQREVLRAAQASFDLMDELHRAGNVTDPQLTVEEVALSRAKLAVAGAEALVIEARESLNVLLGLWGEAVAWRVEGTLEDDAESGLDLERVETRAVAASLDLAENAAHATADARRAGLSRWETVLATSRAGLASKREPADGEWGVGPAVEVNVPLFDHGGTRRTAAEAKLHQSLARHVSLAVEVRSAARRFRERVSALLEQAEFIRAEQLPTASRLVRETLRNYNAMQIGAFEVLVAKQQEIDAARNYVQTLREAWLARLDLEELLAGSLNEGRIVHELALGDHSNPAPMKGGH